MRPSKEISEVNLRKTKLTIGSSWVTGLLLGVSAIGCGSSEDFAATESEATGVGQCIGAAAQNVPNMPVYDARTDNLNGTYFEGATNSHYCDGHEGLPFNGASAEVWAPSTNLPNAMTAWLGEGEIIMGYVQDSNGRYQPVLNDTYPVSGPAYPISSGGWVVRESGHYMALCRHTRGECLLGCNGTRMICRLGQRKSEAQIEQDCFGEFPTPLSTGSGSCSASRQTFDIGYTNVTEWVYNGNAMCNDIDACYPSDDLFAQRLTIDETTRTANTSLSDPIVVLGPPSFNGGDPSTTRVDQVSTSFEYFLQEWDYLDGGHTNETIGAIAVERSITSLGTLAARAGSLGVDHNWRTVNFGTTFSAAPVVVAQIASFAGTQAATTRIRNVTTSSFQIRVQEESGNDGTHATETIHWIAVARGTTTVNGRPIRVGRTGNTVTDAWASISFNGTYTNPTFIAEMQTYDGSDPAALRYRNLGNTSVQVKVEEEQSANDPEVAHTTEIVGYIVIGQ